MYRWALCAVLGLPSALSQAPCVAAEGQPEVRVKGSFPELPGGSSCFSRCAQPQTAVTNICWKCFRAMPQLAASAPGEWGTAPQIYQMGSKHTITILCKEICSALGTCGHCQCDCLYRCFSFLLWTAGALEFLYLPLSLVHRCPFC